MPKSPLGHRRIDPLSVPKHVRATYSALIDSMVDRLGLPEDEPKPLYLSPEARGVLDEFRQTVEPDMAPGGKYEAFTGWASKLPGAVVRISGLLHAAKHPASVPESIAADTVRDAIEIGWYLTAHARAAFDEMGMVQESADARYLAAWLRSERRTTVTIREIRIRHRGRLKTEDRTRAAVAVLVDHGFLRERPPEPRSKPGRKPSPTFDVNLAIFQPYPAPKIPELPEIGVLGNLGNSGAGKSQKNGKSRTGFNAGGAL